MIDSAREVALVLHCDERELCGVKSEALYGVRVRRRVLGRLWWGAWRTCISGREDVGFSLQRAKELAAQALVHGWVEVYGLHAAPILVKEDE